MYSRCCVLILIFLFLSFFVHRSVYLILLLLCCRFECIISVMILFGSSSSSSGSNTVLYTFCCCFFFLSVFIRIFKLWRHQYTQIVLFAEVCIVAFVWRESEWERLTYISLFNRCVACCFSAPRAIHLHHRSKCEWIEHNQQNSRTVAKYYLCLQKSSILKFNIYD